MPHAVKGCMAQAPQWAVAELLVLWPYSGIESPEIQAPLGKMASLYLAMNVSSRIILGPMEAR